MRRVDGKGDCYQAAYNAAQGAYDALAAWPDDQRKVFLVHGDVIPPSGASAGKRIGHAWVEVDDRVMERSNGQDCRVSRDSYYRRFQARPRFRYSPEEANLKLLLTGHYGPWDVDTSEPTP